MTKFAATLVAAVSLVAGGALAQEAKEPAAKPAAAAPAAPAAPAKEKAAAPAPAAKEAAPAAAPAKDAAAPAGEGDKKAGEAKTAWYKMCAKLPIKGKDKDGKEVSEDKVACTTFYESFNPATGAPLVYTAVEESEGIDKKILTVVVPTGLALPPGMAVTTFQKEQWEKFIQAGKEGKTIKPEDVGLKALELKYLHCHQTGCASITEVTSEFLNDMQTGVGMLVRAVDISNKVVDFPVPLRGFKEALEGKPVDTQAFMAFRSERLKEMQQKRAELLEQFKKEQAEKKAATAGAAAPAAPADTGAAAKPPAPAKAAEKAPAPAAPAPEKKQ
jgi:invasion protein IalB